MINFELGREMNGMLFLLSREWGKIKWESSKIKIYINLSSYSIILICNALFCYKVEFPPS